MFKRKTKKSLASVGRSRRQPKPTNESFRRNVVVFSRAQKELAAHQQSVTQRQLEKKRRATRRSTQLKLIGGGILLLIGFSLSRMSIGTVEVVSNASSKLTTTQAAGYEAALLKYFNAHTVARQWWLADTASAVAAVKQEFPEIEWVTLSSNAPIDPTLKADVRFRKAVFTWQDAGGQQQFVDGNGVLFSKNMDSSINAKKLIKIEDQSSIIMDTGATVLTKQLIEFIGQLHSKLPPLYANKKVARVVIPRSTREVQVQMESMTYFIKLSSMQDLDQQVGELKTLLAYLQTKNVTPAEYIDIRVPHKAFYK